MAIAKVRIAPVEHWCEHNRSTPYGEVAAKMVGLEIQIEMSSMRPAGGLEGCDGRYWTVLPESQERARKIMGVGSVGSFACEHMLELD